MDHGRQTGAEPYWRRRVLLLAGVIAVIGVFVWSCSPQDPAQKPPRQASAAATSSATQPAVPSAVPTSASPAASASQTTKAQPTATARQTAKARPAAKARQAGRKRAGKRAGMRAQSRGSDCAPGDVVITLVEGQQSYLQPAQPRFTIYVVNTGGQTCTFDAGPRSLRLVVESGPVHEWSPADCVRRSNSDIVRLKHGVPFTKRISWNRVRSSPGCASPRQAALPGTYTATVTYGSIHSQTVVFLLR